MFFVYDSRLWLTGHADKPPHLLVTDLVCRQTIIAEAHNSTSHCGREATFKTISDRYWWLNLCQIVIVIKQFWKALYHCYIQAKYLKKGFYV